MIEETGNIASVFFFGREDSMDTLRFTAHMLSDFN